MEQAFEKLLDKYTDLVRENERIKISNETNETIKEVFPMPPKITCENNLQHLVRNDVIYGD